MLEASEAARADGVLALKTPGYRKAYSDRTAWLMACMAEIAYTFGSPCWPERLLSERCWRITASRSTGER